MKFSLKKLFSRKSKKEEAAPAASAGAAVPEAKPDAQPAAKPAPPVNDRLNKLAQYKQPGGYYLINLDVAVPGASHNGEALHMIQAPETGMILALFSPQQLAGCKTIAMQAEEHVAKTFGLDVGHVYYKRKDAEFYFDGYDQLLGLPPGDGFQLLLVPEGCAWKPDFVYPMRYGIPGTNTVLQHPATLLPQFQPQISYPIVFVNGLDITKPVLPDMPKAKPAAPQEEPQPESKGDSAVQAAAPPPPAPPAPKA